MSKYTTEEQSQIAETIKRQINAGDSWCFAACGASLFAFGDGAMIVPSKEDGNPFLSFKVRKPLGKNGLFKIFVYLIDDLYTVKLIKCLTKDPYMKTFSCDERVSVENLAETVYRACNK